MNQIKELEPQEITTDVLIEKYAKGNETTEDEIYKRVSKGVAQAEKEELREHYEKVFYENMLDGGIGAGRIMSTGGANLSASMINCFVIPIGDAIEGIDEDGYPGIYESVKAAACTMRRGGGVGYNFSRIRPKGAEIKSLDSIASGPCSYMDVFDVSCLTIESAGCFAGDTLINTTDGLIRIKDIVESKNDYYAITHAGPKKITAKFKNGIKPIWRVTTKYGFSVKVTPIHKFAQFENGKIITKEINEIIKSDNTSLLLSIPLNEIIVPKETNDELFAYVIGAFHGNGSWIRNDKGLIKGISISNNVTKINIVEDIAFKMANIGFKGNITKVPNENTIVLDYYDVEFFRKLESYGVTKGDMSIPSFILENTKEIRAAYLAGLFDADGYFSEGKSNIRLRLITYKLIQEVQTLLASLGVMSKLFLERDAVDNWKKLYSVNIYGKYSQDAFLRTVGSYTNQTLINVDTRDRVGYSHKWEYIKDFGHTKTIFSKYWSGNELKHPNISMNAIINSGIKTPELVNTVSDEILYISELPEEETYDLEVEDVHLLSGNGIYTSNSRRGAQLGALNINHPDILEFIKAKRTKGRWNNFNVSVLVSDSFMIAKENDEFIELFHKAKPGKKQLENGAYQRSDGKWVYSKIKAKELWDIIMQSNYDYAEPGILFEDNINQDNNLRYIEYIDTTNPCGEQPLPSNGCCDLGPIILPKLVSFPFTYKANFNFEKLSDIVKTQVRFLDNVLDVTLWPLETQKKESDSKRRIGVGFTGLANTLAMMNVVYYSEEGLHLANRIVSLMRDTAYNESVELAKEKGSFPLFDAEKYLEEGTFASRLPDYIKEKIRKDGIRNSHLLSIAPVGTVSLAFADNASNGIEPPFSLAYTRKKRTTDGGHKHYNVLDHSFRVWLTTQEKEFAKAIEEAVCNYRDKFIFNEKEYKVKDVLPKVLVTALEMTPKQHLDMLKVVVPFIDSAVSKTINCPSNIEFNSYKDIYDLAWKYKLKGVSTYRPNDILGSVLSVKKEKKESVSVVPIVDETTIDLDNGKSIETIVSEMYTQPFDSREDGSLPGVSIKGRFHTNQGEQKFIITVNFLTLIRHTRFGKITIRRPVEFILTSNFTTSSSAWDAAMRFLSLMGRSGVSIVKIIENLREITWEHGNVKYGTRIKDNKQIPLWHSSDAAAIGYIIEEALIKDGYLTKEGKLSMVYKIDEKDIVNDITTMNVDIIKEVTELPPTGSKCPECGAMNLEKREGCLSCSNCGYKGECG